MSDNWSDNRRNWTIFPRPTEKCNGNCNPTNRVIWTKHMDEDLIEQREETIKIVNVVCQQQVPSKKGGKMCGMKLVEKSTWYDADQLVIAIKEHNTVYHNTDFKVVIVK